MNWETSWDNISHGIGFISQNKNRLTSFRRKGFVSGHFEPVIEPTNANAPDTQLVYVTPNLSWCYVTFLWVIVVTVEHCIFDAMCNCIHYWLYTVYVLFKHFLSFKTLINTNKCTIHPVQCTLYWNTGSLYFTALLQEESNSALFRMNAKSCVFTPSYSSYNCWFCDTEFLIRIYVFSGCSPACVFGFTGHPW